MNRKSTLNLFRPSIAVRLLLLIALPCFLKAQSHKDRAQKAEIDAAFQRGWEMVIDRKYDDLLELMLSVEPKVLAVYGENSVQFADCLLLRGKALSNNSYIDTVESCYARARNLYVRTVGKNCKGYISGTFWLGLLYKNYERPADTVAALYREALSLARQNEAYQNTPGFVTLLYYYGSFYLDHGQLDEAEAYLREAFSRQARLKKEDIRYLTVAHDLAYVLSLEKKYELEEPVLQEMVATAEKMYGREHDTYLAYLNNLGELYLQWKLRTALAPEILLRVKNGYAQLYGRESKNYAESNGQYGNALLFTGQYDKAIETFRETLDRFERLDGKISPNYFNWLFQLATAYNASEQYEAAENVYLKVIETGRAMRLFGVKTELWRVYNDLGFLYLKLGNHSSANAWFELSLKEVPDGAAEKPTILNNMAANALNLQQYELADSLLRQTLLLIRQEVSPPDTHPVFGLYLQNLGLLHYYLGHFSTADSIYSQALELLDSKFGSNRSAYAELLLNLGCLRAQTGRINEGIDLMERAGEAWRLEGNKNPMYSVIQRQNLALLFSATEQFDRADSIFAVVAPAQQQLLHEACKFLTEQQLKEYLQAFTSNFHQYCSFAQSRPAEKANHLLPAICLENSWFYKGFLLQSAIRIKNKLQRDTSARALLQQLYVARRRLAQAGTETDSLQSAVWQSDVFNLEKSLTQLAGEAPEKWDLLGVQQKMGPEDALIEFTAYRFYNAVGQPLDSVYYAASVLRPGMNAPLFIPLFEERQLMQVADRPPLASSLLEQFYRERYWTWNNALPSLYNLIWKPLEDCLKGAKRVYFSADGMLHRINIAAIRDADKQYIGNRFHLIQMGSTSRLGVNALKTESSSRSIELFGGIYYAADSFQVKGLAVARGVSAVADSATRAGAWEYLPGTATEIQGIAALSKKQGWTVRLFSGFAASEKQFKQLGRYQPSPRVVHLATHGFFASDPVPTFTPGLSLIGSNTRPSPPADDLMRRSGLVMAGANYLEKNDTSRSHNDDDGVLTAYEIAQMDLSGTELVVLSACNTGLGETSGNEGVFGLQRAFKIAGVRYILMSLWSVDDEVTQQLMQAFYRNWLQNGQSPRDALHAAQQEIRVRYPSPYYWAAFVLVE